MVQHSRQHAPVHTPAEFDDTGRETVALLCEGLDCSPGDTVADGDCRKRHLVAQVAELESCVRAAVDSSFFGLIWGALLQRSAALDPACLLGLREASWEGAHIMLTNPG